MGKRKRHNKSSNFQIGVKKATLSGEIEYCANITVMGSLRVTETMLEGVNGKTVDERIGLVVHDHLRRKFGDEYKIPNSPIKVRAGDSGGRTLLTEFAMRLAEKEMKEQEDKVEYIGEFVPETGGTKKLVVFKFSDIADAWKSQREIWDNWKEFIRVYIEDEGVEFDVEIGDKPGFKLEEESILRKGLLKRFPEDAEKLGFTRVKKEEPTV